jgi:3-hydroxybutyryl-CoA dehydrogenase
MNSGEGTVPAGAARQFGVVGFGTMGSEIALLAACAGYTVLAVAQDAERFETLRTRLGKQLRLLARDEKFFAAGAIAEETGREAVLARLTRADDLAALADCTAVIESVPEDVELKQRIFSELGHLCRPDALLATNTSSVSITALAAGTRNPERVVGMHFFNPPLMMGLIEVIPGLQTSEDGVTRALELAARFGKKGIRVKETPGFVVNRILLAMINEAMVLRDEGIASVEDIDEAMKLGAGVPLGPFKLADLVGLDVYLHTCESILRERGDAKFTPPFSLKQLVRAGKLGRKTRHGFYKY